MTKSKTARHQRIMAQLLDRKHVTVKELADAMDVSDATVRRDLRILADERSVELTHGGASLPVDRDFSYQAKALRAQEAKQAIGKLASTIITEGSHIFLDSGTTCSEIVPYLGRMHNVTVLANSARLALDLDKAGVHLFLIGGQYRPDRMDTVGPMALRALDSLRGYVAFIGADGISMEFGPSASDVESAYLHSQVVQNASETVLLIDHSKFGCSSLFQIIDWPHISKVLTDQAPPQEWQEFFAERSIPVVWPTEISAGEENHLTSTK